MTQASKVPWRFDETDTHLLRSLELVPAPYQISILSKAEDRSSLRITISDGQKERYFWIGHRFSVFRIADHKLYVVFFSPEDSGAEATAVDLQSGKVLWTSKLRALGDVDHSKYRNRVNVGLEEGKVIVYGDETMGRYVEVLDASNGAMVYQKKYQRSAE